MKQPKKRKAGRPPLPNGSAKAGALRVRVTPKELKAIQGKAGRASKTVSEWIRAVVSAALDG